MLAIRNRVIAIFVDRSAQQWIVKDADGNFWAVHSGENAWNHREPFHPTEDTELEPVPGHYKYLFHLPF